jgi:hypothetical protein
MNNGLLTCARYAFSPNYFQYCGPDENKELGGYLSASAQDKGLAEMLGKFGTLHSYLKTIAVANKLQDPFDPRVVEAYWLGNDLLSKVDPQLVYEELTLGQKLTKRLSTNSMKWVLPKINQGARLHHSFHVFNVFMQTGHPTVEHTVETMDQCRIGWGKVIAAGGNKLEVDSQRIKYRDGKLYIEPNVIREIKGVGAIAGKIKVNDMVSYHWGWLCDKITTRQAQNLAKYTQFHLELANETI